jgi:LuxR family maltose regulon positive regulatory protein
VSSAKLALVVAALLPQALSDRERDILHLIAQGRVDREIAHTLAISPATVKSHVGSIFTKLNVQKRAHAVSRAQRLGLIAPS